MELAGVLLREDGAVTGLKFIVKLHRTGERSYDRIMRLMWISVYDPVPWPRLCCDEWLYRVNWNKFILGPPPAGPSWDGVIFSSAGMVR